MPVQLPDRTSLGGYNAPRSGRAIASVRGATDAARAEEQAALQSARGIEQAGRAVVGYAEGALADDEKQRQAEIQDQVATAKSDFLVTKAELEAAFENDSDYATFDSRYQKALDEKLTEIASGITDDRARAQFNTAIRPSVTEGLLSVRSLARKKEVDAGRARLAQMKETNLALALEAKDPETVDAALGSYHDAIDASLAKGYLTEQEAQKLRSGGAEEYAERSIATMDPWDRLQALGFGGNDPSGMARYLPADKRQEEIESTVRTIEAVERRREAEINRAEKEIEDREKEIADRTAKEGISLAATGDLTPEWVEDRQAVLSVSDYRSLMSAASGSDGEDNRVVVADMYRSIAHGEDITDRAIAAFADGDLTRSTMSTILSRNDSRQQKSGAQTPFQRASTYLNNALRPSDLNDNPDAAAAYANAEADLMDFFDNNPAATVDAGMKIARELAGAYRLTPGTSLSLPFADWMVGDRNARKPDLDATEEAIVRAMSNGDITQEEAIRRAKQINKWRQFEQESAL